MACEQIDFCIVGKKKLYVASAKQIIELITVITATLSVYLLKKQLKAVYYKEKLLSF